VEGPQASEHIDAGELENVSKVKDPNMGRVSRSHVKSLPHLLPPLLTHFLHQFQHYYFTLLWPIVPTYKCHENFCLIMSLPAMSFEDRFFMSRKSRIAGLAVGGGLIWAWSRKTLVGTRSPISVLFGKKDLDMSHLTL